MQNILSFLVKALSSAAPLHANLPASSGVLLHHPAPPQIFTLRLALPSVHQHGQGSSPLLTYLFIF